MTTTPVLAFHIAAAIIGLLSGFGALFSRKGSRLHRRSGNVFFVSMLSMASSAAYLALVKSQNINAIVGGLTCYMTATGWFAVKRCGGSTHRFDGAAMIVGFAISAGALFLGWGAMRSASGLDGQGIPAAAYFVFGTIGLAAAALDARLLVRGGIAGAHRIVRHLWRMCFALLITSVSFFNGTRSQMLPAVIRETPIHDIPAIAVALCGIFWMFRVLFSKVYRKPQHAKL